MAYSFSLLPALVAAAAGYLLGNIQTAIIISKRFFHDDVRHHGSGNAGTANMVRVFGLKPGSFTFAGDFLKAVVGVLVGRLLMGELGGYIGGLFVVVGHCWPAFTGFHGGKGVASSYGIAWMTFPLGAAVTTAVIVAVILIDKRMSVMSLSGMVTFFITTLIWLPSPVLCALAGVLTVIVFLRHRDNIKRVIAGTEPKMIK